MRKLFLLSVFTVISVIGLRAQDSPQAASALGASASDRDHSEIYYNYVMGHLDEERYEDTGNDEYADQAIAFYKKALELDPDAPEISQRLAEIYAKSQRIRDAVLLARQMLIRDPNNLEAHQLLARIYVRTLGDLSASATQKETIAKAIEQYTEILRIDPTDLNSTLWLARLYRFQNQHDKAAEVLRSLLQRDPANESALEQYTQLLLDQGHPAEAIERLQQAVEQTASPKLLDLLGDAYFQTHDDAKAEQAYRKAIDVEPDEPSHRQGLAQVFLSEKKYDQALEQYQSLEQMEPDDAENYLRVAEIYLQENKPDLAEASVLRAKQRAPGSLEVIYNEAMVYQAQGRYNDAAHLLSDALARLKKDGQASGENARPLSVLYEQLGRVYRRQENYPAALEAFRELMKLGPADEKQGRLEIIETYRASGQIDPAIAEARKAMEATPHDRGAKSTYALLLSEKTETDQAAEILHGMLNGSPQDREVYLELAQAYERGRRYAEAEQAAQAAEKIALHTGESDAALFLLGAIYERQKKYDLAEEEFRKALKLNPRDAEVLNYYGYMLADRGIRLEEATQLVKRALAVENNNGAYLDSLGWVYYKQNRLADAEEYLLKAVKQNSHEPTVLGHLGDVYFKMGRASLAISTWEKALAEWQRALPAEYEAEKVNELEHKLTTIKRAATQNPTNSAEPQ